MALLLWLSHIYGALIVALIFMARTMCIRSTVPLYYNLLYFYTKILSRDSSFLIRFWALRYPTILLKDTDFLALSISMLLISASTQKWHSRIIEQKDLFLIEAEIFNSKPYFTYSEPCARFKL